MSGYTPSYHPLKRKRRVASFLVLALALAAVIFHKPLLKSLIKAGLHWSLHLDKNESLDIGSLTFQGKRLVLKEITLHKKELSFHVDEIYTHIAYDKTRSYFEVRLNLIHPEIYFHAEKKEMQHSLFPLWAPGKHWGIKMEAQYGVLNNALSGSQDRLYFHLKSIDSPDHLGLLTISSDPSEAIDPFIQIDCWHIDGQMRAEFQLKRTDLHHLRRLASCVAPKLFLDELALEGELEGEGKISYCAERGFQSFNGNFTAEEVHVSDAQGSFRGKLGRFHATIDYHAPEILEEQSDLRGEFFRGMQIMASLSDGEVAVKDPAQQDGWGLKGVDAHALILPRTEPSLTLNAIFVHGKDELPLHIQGKGAVMKDQKYWLEVECEGFRGQQKDLHGYISLCRPDPSNTIVQLDIQSLTAQHWSWVRDVMRDVGGKYNLGRLHKGSLNGVCSAAFSEGKLISLEWHRGAFQDVHYTSPRGLVEISLGSCSTEGELVRGENNQWVIKRSQSTLKEGACLFKHQSFPVHCEKITGEILIQDNSMASSALEGVVSGFDARASLVHNQGILECELTLQGDACHLLKKTETTGILLDIESHLRWKESLDWDGSLACRCGDRTDILAFGGSFESQAGEWEGWLRSEKISGDILTPCARSLGIEGALEGDIDLYGIYNKENIHCSIQSDLLSFTNGKCRLSVVGLGQRDPQLIQRESRAECTYVWKTRDFLATVPVSSGQLLYLPEGISISDIAGDFTVTGNGLSCMECSANMLSSAFSGKLNFEWGEKRAFHWSMHSAAGQIQEWLSFIQEKRWADLKNVQCNGQWSIGREGMAIEGVFEDQGISLSARGIVSMTDLCASIDSSYGLQGGRCSLEVDTGKQSLCIQEAAAELVSAKGIAIGVLHMPSLEIPYAAGMEGNFTCSLQEMATEALGKVERLENGWMLTFNGAHTVVMGCPLKKGMIHISAEGAIDSLDARGEISFGKLPDTIELAKRLGFLNPSFLKLTSLEGLMHVGCSWERISNHLSVHIESPSIQGQALNCMLEKNQEQWVLTHGQWGGLRATATFNVLAEALQVPAFQCHYKELHLRGNAVYDVASGKGNGNFQWAPIALQRDLFASAILKGSLQGKGSFNIHPASQETPWQIESMVDFYIDADSQSMIKAQGKSRISWKAGDPLSIEKLKIQITDSAAGHNLCQIFTENCLYDWPHGTLSTKKAHISLSPESLLLCSSIQGAPSWLRSLQLEEPIRMQCAMSLGSDMQRIEGRLAETYAGLWGYPLHIHDIKMRLNGSCVEMRGSVLIEKEKLWFRTLFDPKAETIFSARLSASEDAEGIQAEFKQAKNGVELHKIEGKLAGIQTQFTAKKLAKGQPALQGSLAVDLKETLRYLPISMQKKLLPWKIGKGFSFYGILALPHEENPFSLKGEIHGENCEIGGYCFEHIAAQIAANATKMIAEEIECRDRACALEIKKLYCSQNPEKEWICHIPILQMRDFRPSALRPVHGPEKTLKPFVVSHLTLRNISGKAQDIQSFSGEGIAHFSNGKRDMGIFEVPLALLKDWGLDPALLSPASGEAALLLQKGKLYFTQLSQCFSDRRLSEFYLAEQPSFIALDGKVNIHLRLKQYSMLKIAEPFTFSITGTVDKLQYSMK